ncbi:MAG: cyclic pyranopterin monophosphate synthase MoaC, partial [Yaniella sp.]|nr:cyclic pyranopterin monophosphate synthase MoaC [Yaniella sp.]
MEQQLSHVRADGSAHMVDVTTKGTTSRTSRAQAIVHTR